MIALLTDFGTKDSFVAQMKGAMLRLYPESTFLDISHDIPAHDIVHAAFVLEEAAKEAPAESIFLCVVDPEVGTSRKRVILEVNLAGRKQTFVGPDNGIFSRVLTTGTPLAAWNIENLNMLPARACLSTFDGRDIFAPVAALLQSGLSPQEFGPSRDFYTLRVFPSEQITLQPDAETQGKIVYLDSFGNSISNIAAILAEGLEEFFGQIDGWDEPISIYPCYEEIPPGKLGLIVNSQGVLELAAFRDSAAVLGRIVRNQTIRIKRGL